MITRERAASNRGQAGLACASTTGTARDREVVAVGLASTRLAGRSAHEAAAMANRTMGATS